MRVFESTAISPKQGKNWRHGNISKTILNTKVINIYAYIHTYILDTLHIIYYNN